MELSRGRNWLLFNVVFARFEVNVECLPQICWNLGATLVFYVKNFSNLYPNSDHITASSRVIFPAIFLGKIDFLFLTPAPWSQENSFPLPSGGSLHSNWFFIGSPTTCHPICNSLVFWDHQEKSCGSACI